jgi:hypothetical protein
MATNAGDKSASITLSASTAQAASPGSAAITLQTLQAITVRSKFNVYGQLCLLTGVLSGGPKDVGM